MINTLHLMVLGEMDGNSEKKLHRPHETGVVLFDKH